MTNRIDRSGTQENPDAHGKQDTRDYYLRLFDDFPNPIWRAGLDAKCDYFNRAWLAFTGRTLEQEKGDGWVEGVHPEDLDRCVATYSKAFHVQQPFEMEYRLRFHDGSYRWLLDTGKPFYDPSGTFSGYIGSCYDIDNRKRAEIALAESEKQYRELVENLSEVIVSLNRNGEFIYVSPVVEPLYGYAPGDLIGQHFLQFIHPDDREHAVRIFGQELSGTYPTDEFRILLKDSSIRWFTISPRPLYHEGHVTGFNYVLTDITERKRAEVEERLTRERFETLVKVAEMQDASEQVVSEFVMQAACRMTESSLAFIGTMTPDETVMDIIAWSATVMEDCRVASAPLHFPVEKAGLWADAIREHRPKIVNDYSAPHSGKKGVPKGHVKISRFLSLPVIENGKVVMLAAVANKQSPYNDADVTRLTLLMQGVWGNIRKRRAEEALKQNEALLSEMEKTAQIGGWELDVQTNGVCMTPETYRISETPENERLDMDRAVKLFDLPGRTLLESALQRCAESGEPFDIELPFTTAKGRHIWTRAIGRAVRQDNKIIRLTGTVQDITPRKRAEEALRQSEERFRTLSETSQTGIYIFQNGTILYVNPTFARIYGYTPEEMLGMDPLSLVTPEDRAFVKERMQARLDKKEKISEYESRMVTKDQRIINVRIMGAVIPFQGRPAIAGNLLDITEQKRAEEALRESEERYRILFDESPISLWEEDLSDIRFWLDTKKEEGINDFRTYFEMHPEDVPSCIRMVTVTRINRATEALFGTHSLKEFSESLSSVFTPESYTSFREELIAIGMGRTAFEGEVPLHALSGEKKIALLKMLVVPGFESTLKKVFISFIDITEQKKVEDSLRQANKKITMLSSITRHDIKNQLMGLRIFLELTKEKIDDPELLDFLKKENGAADAIGRQIEFTKFYEELGVNAPAWQDIPQIIKTAKSQLPLPDTLEVAVDLPPLKVYADGLIEKVFYNLMENTLRHGEHVTRIRFSLCETEYGAEIVYEDNGVGISREDKQHLFQKGFGKNTGLGLFLSREILAITGLTIQESGEPGKGVRFVISVPKEAYLIGGA